MPWTDKASLKHIRKLRDLFKVKVFVETGTFKGVNVLAHRNDFDLILSCENNKKYYNQTCKKINKYWYDAHRIFLYHSDSSEFLESFKTNNEFQEEMVIFYLDAHFYDKKAKNKFVVLDELKALSGLNCIIIIHDFDNGLGHITYDGQSLNFKLLEKALKKVNPNFKFYTNELSSCDPLKPSVSDIISIGLKPDRDIMDNLKYAWSKPEKTYRGILYCVPNKINVEGLRNYETCYFNKCKRQTN